jgi:hypothetical protein
LFSSPGIGEGQWFGELLRAHQETGAIDGPWSFQIHNSSFYASGNAHGNAVSDEVGPCTRPMPVFFWLTDLTGRGQRSADNDFG